jgi:hypothetical protein
VNGGMEEKRNHSKDQNREILKTFPEMEMSLSATSYISFQGPPLQPRKLLLRRWDIIPTVGTPTKFGRQHAFFAVTSDIITK